MFINGSAKRTGGLIMLKTSLVLVVVVLIASTTAEEAQDATFQTRNHKAMRPAGGSGTETRSATNEQSLQHEDENESQPDEDPYGSSSVEDVDDGDSDRSSDGSSEHSRVTTDASSEQQDVTTPGSVNYVATTPKISKSAKILSRYEQGLEDYEEAAARVEQEDNRQREQEKRKQQPFGSMINPMLSSLFNVVNALSSKRSFEVLGPSPALLFSAWNSLKGDVGTSARAIGDAEKSTRGDDADNQNGNSTDVATAAESARYIKGDPLNGYYDFVISEGSYKFWAAFQVATAVLIIYSTFAAIYYSKVSPLTSDYDYIDYLNGGRSFAGGRAMDAAAPAAARRSFTDNMWDGLLEKPWFNVATNSFAFVMNAIESAPK
ncbi:uncharacterized protein LOC134217085 [Armigeres subalbatus]|uniref:uncharacterized protein LOC134217085 n=1 Tax=Armigeres subalbatus TaxID=124917 RepID=UPI002ED4E65B